MDSSAIALQDLQYADAQLNAVASAIANAGDGSSGVSLDVVTLSQEMVALMSAQTDFAANLATLKVADQMQQNLLNVTA